MRNVSKFVIFIVALFSVIHLNGKANSQIIVEDAAFQKNLAVEPLPVFPDIPPRMVLDYASTTMIWNLVYPGTVLQAAQGVMARIIMEYASARHLEILEYPYDVLQAAQWVEPRIVIEYASTVGRFRELVAFGCAQAMFIFTSEFGRTDCSPGAPCKGDLNTDGDVDGEDLREFSLLVETGDCSGFGL